MGHATLCPVCPSSSGPQGPVTVAMNRPQQQGQGCESVFILNTVYVCLWVCAHINCMLTFNLCVCVCVGQVFVRALAGGGCPRRPLEKP